MGRRAAVALTHHVLVAEPLGVGLGAGAVRAVLVVHHLARHGGQVGLGKAVLRRVVVHEGDDVGQLVAAEQDPRGQVATGAKRRPPARRSIRATVSAVRVPVACMIRSSLRVRWKYHNAPMRCVDVLSRIWRRPH